MAHYSFEKDIFDGQQAEREAIEKLKTYFSITDDADFEICDTNEYDIRIVSKNLTFEVKNDLMAAKTGNVAIEYESRGKNSGINATQADFLIYKFTGLFFLIKTETIKEELFEKHNFFRNVTGGDTGSFTKMFLVKIEEFKNWGIEL